MPSLTLKNISDELMDEFCEVVEQERRSITQQVLYIFKQAIAWREAAKQGAERELKSASGSEET